MGGEVLLTIHTNHEEASEDSPQTSPKNVASEDDYWFETNSLAPCMENGGFEESALNDVVEVSLRQPQPEDGEYWVPWLCGSTAQEDSYLSTTEPISLVACNPDDIENISPQPGLNCGAVSEEFNEAYAQGALVPYLYNLVVPVVEDSSKDDGIHSWNGHIPLCPYPPLSPPRRRRRRRSQIGTFRQLQMEPPMASQIQIEDGEDIELFFVKGDDQGAAPAKSGGRARRAPAASESMSIPASQMAAIQKQVSQSQVPPPTSTRRLVSSGKEARPDEVEKVQVQQPGADRAALKDLPALRDAPQAKREELFVLKLKLCSVIFSFDDPNVDKRGKDLKRQTLLELVDYVNTPAGQKIFTESCMPELMSCISANVCRALPPATDDFDPEEDEPVLEPAWPHLQVAYEFFLRFIVSSEVNAKAAKKYVDQKFCLQLVELFDSEDPRERDYLKTILHRIYGKFMSHRSFIRRAISNVFYRFVYETERHNGIGELLEILGSIINGFAIPLKKEHLQFLVRALIPLHKPKCVALYHQQLSYCIIQYVEKDADTATPILNGFFKCWPWSCSNKQVMFLNELEEILELLGADQLAQVSDMLFTNLSRCLDSDHFQVVERALFLWNNEHLVNSGCLSRINAQTVLPIIYGPLYKNSSGHWNATVEGLAQNVLKMYMEYDLVLYDKCTAAYFREEEEAKKKLDAITDKWDSIEQVALTNRATIAAN